MNKVQLRNGSTAPASEVRRVMAALEMLTTDHEDIVSIYSLYDIVQKARQADYQLIPEFGSKQRLIDLHLLTRDGTVAEDVRNIIVSAVEGEELDLAIVWPTVTTETVEDIREKLKQVASRQGEKGVLIGTLSVVADMVDAYGIHHASFLLDTLLEYNIRHVDVWRLYKYQCGEQLAHMRLVLLNGTAVKLLQADRFSTFYNAKQ